MTFLVLVISPIEVGRQEESRVGGEVDGESKAG